MAGLFSLATLLGASSGAAAPTAPTTPTTVSAAAGAGDVQGQQTQTQTQQQTTTTAGGDNNAAVKSPLDGFAALWQTNGNGVTAPDFNADAITFKPEQMQAIATKISSINFLQGVAPEKITAALSGNAEAFQQVINSAVSTAFLQSMQLNGAMVNTGLKQRSTALLEHIPELVRRSLTENRIVADNPLFNDPSVAPMLSMVKDTLIRNHPNLTAQQASEAAKLYLEGMAKAILAANGQQQQTKPTQEETGWDTFFKS